MDENPTKGKVHVIQAAPGEHVVQQLLDERMEEVHAEQAADDVAAGPVGQVPAPFQSLDADEIAQAAPGSSARGGGDG